MATLCSMGGQWNFRNRAVAAMGILVSMYRGKAKTAIHLCPTVARIRRCSVNKVMAAMHMPDRYAPARPRSRETPAAAQLPAVNASAKVSSAVTAPMP